MYFGVDRLAILIATAVMVGGGVAAAMVAERNFFFDFGSKIHLRTKNLEKGEKRKKGGAVERSITAENDLSNFFRGLPNFCRTGATRTNSHVIFFFLVLSLMNLTKKHKKLAKH